MDWFKSKATLKQEIIAELTAAETAKEELRNQEPWVDIKGAVEDEKHGLKIELDWNDAFIDYLRENGINGADDDTVIQKWITMLYADLMEHGQQDGHIDNLT